MPAAPLENVQTPQLVAFTQLFGQDAGNLRYSPLKQLNTGTWRAAPPARAFVEKVCTSCRGLETVFRAYMRKQRCGATASGDGIDQINKYLAANFGPPKQKEDPKP